MVLIVMISALLFPEIDLAEFYEWKEHLLEEFKTNLDTLIKKNIKKIEDTTKVKKNFVISFLK